MLEEVVVIFTFLHAQLLFHSYLVEDVAMNSYPDLVMLNHHFLLALTEKKFLVVVTYCSCLQMDVNS